jgi:hypothetical protein
MLDSRHIQARHRLARRLLWWGTKIVSNTALYGLVIYCIGCVIPTPLDRAPAPTNFSPVFVTNRVSPTFGATTAQVQMPKSFTLAATDPNHDDTLQVRLYTTDSTGQGMLYTGINTTLNYPSTPDPDDPNLRIGEITTAPCPVQLQGTTFELFAIVADRDFSPTMPSKVQAGGLSDTNHWELQCL